MSNTEDYISGKCKWAHRLFTPDLDYKCWSVVIWPNEESMAKINALKAGSNGVQGILNTIKKDDDGYNLTLKRPTEKVMRGKLVGFAPPMVVDKDGTPHTKADIGNGSDLTCKIEIRTYKIPTSERKGTAIRLIGVRVDNLVPFEKADFPDAEQRKQVEGLQDAPSPLF